MSSTCIGWLTSVFTAKFSQMLVDLFTMAETNVRMSVVLYNLNTFLLLHLVICGRSLRSSPSTTNGLNNFADSSLFQHGNILSPLLRALSEQGGEYWRDVGPNPKQQAKPTHVRYMKRLYKKSVSQKGAAGTNPLFNTVRLITPRECLERSKGKQTSETVIQHLNILTLK